VSEGILIAVKYFVDVTESRVELNKGDIFPGWFSLRYATSRIWMMNEIVASRW